LSGGGKGTLKIYNKLIRDNIPEIMDAKGVGYSVRVLDEQEYIAKLNEKLQEELDEYHAAGEAEQVEELADLVELVYSILDAKGVSLEAFESIRLMKREKRGGFGKKLLLEYTKDRKEQ
jgi:predicted house-cleaning noncanonical NTP pyrophosphatase (MazG superfamily)